MMLINIDYPTPDEEIAIAQLVSGHFEPVIRNVFKGEDLPDLHSVVRSVPVAHNVLEYAYKIVSATRPEASSSPSEIRNLIQWGAGPRATIHLITAAKAKAILSGRCYVMMDDVRSLFVPVVAHRVVRSFQAEADGISSELILTRILEETKE
jgi:MoxR-like ATPase